MSKTKVTSETIKALFQEYDDLSAEENPIQCAGKVAKYLSNLLESGSVPASFIQRTSERLDILRQKVESAEESSKIYLGDETDPIASSKKKNDELSLRFAITKAKELLYEISKFIEEDSRKLKFAVAAVLLGVFAGIGATYVLYLFYPLKTWVIGQYAWQIGWVVSLIAVVYVWKVLRSNSSPIQVIISVILTPLFAMITTVAIVLSSSALNYYILQFAGDSKYNLFFGAQPTIHLKQIIDLIPLHQILVVGIIASFLVGFLIAVVASFLESRILDIDAFKPHVPEEKN
jgi:hypothetical protein